VNCTEAQKLILLSRSGELARWQRRRLEKHLSQCAGCRRYAQDLDAVTALIKNALPRAEPPPVSLPLPTPAAVTLHERWGVYRLAVAAAVALLVVGIWLGPVRYRMRALRGVPPSPFSESRIAGRLQSVEQELSALLRDISSETTYDPYAAMDADELSRQLLEMEGS